MKKKRFCVESITSVLLQQVATNHSICLAGIRFPAMDDARSQPTSDNATAHRARQLITGDRLGPYEVVSLIGVGGMGHVYKARDTRLGCSVAIKLLGSHVRLGRVLVPIESPDFRCNPDGRFSVACSRDRGKTWQLLTKGLPQRNAHLGVFRHAMYADPLSPSGVYVGTTGGTLFYSRDSGRSWNVLADYLPPINSIAGAVR